MFSISLVIRQMQIKTTKTTLSRRALIKRQKIASVGKCIGIGTLIYYWQECKMIQLLWKTVGQLLKKININL